ncbi:hypothetical protein MAHJHV63_47470 [Mycobacterium avium subsp. hominissuis]
MNAWAPQQRHLVRDLGDDVKLVFYDHRGHGASAAVVIEHEFDVIAEVAHEVALLRRPGIHVEAEPV